jgi:hypothetical protein
MGRAQETEVHLETQQVDGLPRSNCKPHVRITGETNQSLTGLHPRLQGARSGRFYPHRCF